MAKIDDVKKRFQGIASEWGLEAPGAEKRLDAVVKWLAGGIKTPNVVLQATQVLLIDPEHTSARKRPVFVGVIQQLGTAWLDLGAKDVFLLQAMLLAAGLPESSAVAGMAKAGWEVQHGRESQRKALEGWGWQGSQVMNRSIEAMATSLPLALPPKKPKIKVDPDELATALTALKGASQGHLQYLVPHIPRFADIAVQSINKLNAESEFIENELKLTKESMSGLAKTTSDLVEIVKLHLSTTPHPELDLLWWGQARYCHTQRSPYRRLFKDPDQRDLSFVHACMEAAERAKTLDPEPAAAFLIETLEDIGWDPDERRPIRAWMDSTTAALKTASPLPALSPALFALASHDALGLPATRARLSAQGVPEPADAPALPDAETLEIDRGQWASWLFREQVLNLRMSP